MSARDGSLTLTELAATAGLKPRTLRYWIASGILPRPRFRGTSTTYGAQHLVLARAALRLQKSGVKLPDIKKRLAKMNAEELAKLGAPPVRPLDAVPPPPPAPTYPAERWEHVVLGVGIELRVRGDASLLVRRIAQEIYTHYGPQVAG